MIWKLGECNVIEERPIPSHPGYAATSDGRIISLERITSHGHHRKCGIMKPYRLRGGHLRVTVHKQGVHFGKLVHRLVLEAYVGPCPEGMEACHNNGDPRDNRIENLRWDTRSANHLDAAKHGTHPGLRRKGEGHPLAKLTELDVRWIRYLEKAGISRKDLAEVYSICGSNVSAIVTRRSWGHIPEPVYG